MGNSRKEEKAERTRQEMEAGAERIRKIHAEQFVRRLEQQFNIQRLSFHGRRPSLTIEYSMPDGSRVTENYEDFPSETLKGLMVLMGKQQ